MLFSSAVQSASWRVKLPSLSVFLTVQVDNEYSCHQQNNTGSLVATVVSGEPFSHGTGTLRCLQKEMAAYRHWSVSLWRDPDDVSHCRILSLDKTEWQLISATLCGWRCCFVGDQLWFMTCIREEVPMDSIRTRVVTLIPQNIFIIPIETLFV